MKRALAWLLASLVLLLLVSFPLGAALVRHNFYDPRIQMAASDLEIFLPEIEDDLKAISKRNPFENGTRLRNAAPFIVQHVALNGDAIERFATPSHLALRGLFDQYPVWMSDPKQEADFLKSPEISKIDTSWIGELDGYDHIDSSTIEPIKSRLALIPQLGSIERIVIATSLPVIDVTEITKFATIHVLQAKGDESRRSALSHLHNIAMLYQSEGTLVGQMAAVAALGRERWLAEKLKVSNWPTFSQDELSRIRRVPWVWPGLFRLSESRQFSKRLLPFMERRFGACAGATEATVSGLDQLFDYFEPQFPLETSFTDDLNRSRKLKRETLEACGQAAFLPLLVPPKSYWERAVGPTPEGVPTWIRHLPYVRRVVGMILNGIAALDTAKFYKAE